MYLKKTNPVDISSGSSSFVSRSFEIDFAVSLLSASSLGCSSPSDSRNACAAVFVASAGESGAARDAASKRSLRATAAALARGDGGTCLLLASLVEDDDSSSDTARTESDEIDGTGDAFLFVASSSFFLSAFFALAPFFDNAGGLEEGISGTKIHFFFKKKKTKKQKKS